MDLFLECVVWKELGVSEALVKKTRREVCEAEEGYRVRLVTIRGRQHVCYSEDLLAAVVAGLCGKKTRGGRDGARGLDDGSWVALKAAALVRGVLCENEGVPERAEGDVLVVRRVGKNRMTVLAEHAGAEVRLRVRDSRRFVPGMEVPGCRQIGPEDWVFIGRSPRARGRW